MIYYTIATKPKIVGQSNFDDVVRCDESEHAVAKPL